MRVIVFGGAGDMGSRAVEDLAHEDGVERLTIADRNVTAATALAARLRDAPARIEVAAVDARDHGALVARMRGYDVAASALGPFYEFEPRLVRAAIEAGVDYASICDDWSAAKAVLDEFDAAARGAGRIVLTGLGASPGLTNVGVRYFANEVDRVRRVDISVYQPLNAGGGEAVLRHMLYVMTGEVPSWREGRTVMLPACSEERVVEFPRFGRVTVWNMGHAEPVTVPRFFPDIEECNFFMGFGVGSGPLVWLARNGVFSRAAVANAVVSVASGIERLMPASALAHGAVRMDIWGEVDGSPVQRMACGIGEMRAVTGLSLAVGTLMLGRKELLTDQGGVYAPEACLRADAFLAAMRAKGIETYADLAMREPVGAPPVADAGQAVPEDHPAP